MSAATFFAVEGATDERPLLFLPVETKVRELDAKLLLALVAAEAGWKVILGSQKELRRNVWRFPPGIYIDKSVTVNRAKWFRYCKSMGHTVVAWDEEGLVFFDPETLKEMRLGEQSITEVEMMFAWGDRQKAAIQSMLPDLPDIIKVTGNPRFDLLRSETRTLYEQSSIELRKQHGRFILVNTSFPFANHFLGEEAMHAMYARYPIIEKRPNFFMEWARVHEAALESFRTMIPGLAEAFPNHTIIVRPHPSENHDKWRTWLRQAPRVRVSASGPVVEWIAAADFIVHFDCTTGIEAFAMDVSAIAFDEKHVPGYRQPLPNALSYHASNVEELIRVGRKILSGELSHISRDEAMRKVALEHIASLEGPFAAERIVEALQEFELIRKSPPLQRMKRLQARSYALFILVRDNVQKYLKKRESSYSAQKFPPTSLADIQTRADKFSEILRRFRSVRISEIDANCFEMQTEAH